MKKKRLYMRRFLRCLVLYNDITHVRSIHFAVNPDYVDNFVSMIKDTFVHPHISFTDILYSYDERDFFNLI